MALMKKNMVRMLISVAILFVLVFGYKAMHALFHYRYLSSHRSQVIDVSVITAAYTKWQPQLEVVGSVRAQLGINVTTELAGMIRTIYFSPGAMVAKGDLLVELNIDPDIAKLHQLEASATLADIIYRRDKAQYAIAAISKATLDTDEANLKNADAMVAQQTAVIAQKTIRAPFSGRLGICVVNPGQYLNPGDKVTSLQVWDPIYVDFYVPQQWINRIKVGQQVQVKMTTGSRQSFAGKITTIDAAFDPSVR